MQHTLESETLKWKDRTDFHQHAILTSKVVCDAFLPVIF